MLVKDFMTTAVITANLRDGLHQTFHRMLERDVRHMPVLGEDGKLVGIISERDLRRPDFVDDDPNTVHYYVLDNSLHVESAMRPSPVTVKADDNMTKAVDLFVQHKIGAVPVVDDGGLVVGILSAVDALRAFRLVLSK